MSPHVLPRFTAVALLLVCGSTHAAAPAVPNAGSGTVQYAFTPGARADAMIIAAIASARQQVLVQAYSFTHRRIAEALISARNRGIRRLYMSCLAENSKMQTIARKYERDVHAWRNVVRDTLATITPEDLLAACRNARPDLADVWGTAEARTKMQAEWERGRAWVERL